MRRIFIIIGSLAATAFVFHSCSEDTFLEPTPIDLKIMMTDTKPFGQLPAPVNMGALEFSEGTLQLDEIEFNGTKENDDNYYFSTQFDSVLVADLANNSMNQQVYFDIPQGSYNPIKFTLHIQDSGNIAGLKFRGKWTRGRGEDDEEEDEDDKYRDDNGETEVELNFFEHRESIELTLQTEEGNKKIVFNQGNWNRVEIRVNLAHLFRSINPGAFEKAEISEAGKKPKIIISANHNSEMYYSLAHRVERSIKAVVK